MPKPSPYFVQESIQIAADLPLIWGIMIDWEAYPRWNPFIVQVHCHKRPGKPDNMLFELRWPDGSSGRSKEQMISRDLTGTDSAELKYRYNSILANMGLLKATRIQTLKRKGNQVEYATREEFSGILARFVPFAAVKQGFITQAQALKTAAESQAQRPESPSK